MTREYYLTPAGLKVVENILSRAAQQLDRYGERLNRKEREAFYHALDGMLGFARGIPKGDAE